MATEQLSTDILIVGAGFAGAATAYHLSGSTDREILVIDKEDIPGFHASGRNASLLLQSTLPAEVREATVRSRHAYEQIRDQITLHPGGSLLLGTRRQLDPLCDPSIESEYQDPDRIRSEMPVLEGHSFEAALFTPSDGTIDISKLLHYYVSQARSRGVRFLFGCEIGEIQRSDRFQVRGPRHEISAGVLVNAAGAWAPGLSRQAGAQSLPLVSFKRHLFILDNPVPVAEESPFVWSLPCGFYFRPESGGVLFSVCDEERCSSLEPTVSDEIAEQLAELIWRHLPGFQDAVQRKVWSCFRTKTPDDLFMIGWDSSLADFFWVAGLGGHGMGASWEIGRLAADCLLHPSREADNPFRVDRKIQKPAL